MDHLKNVSNHNSSSNGHSSSASDLIQDTIDVVDSMPSHSSLSSSSTTSSTATSSNTTSTTTSSNTGSSTLNHIDTALNALGGDSTLHSAYPFSEQHRARPHPASLSSNLNAQKSAAESLAMQQSLGRFAPSPSLGLSAASSYNPLWGQVGSLRSPYLQAQARNASSAKSLTSKNGSSVRSKAYEDKVDKQRLEHILFSGDQSTPVEQAKERMRKKLENKKNKSNTNSKRKKRQSLPNGSSSNGLLAYENAKKQKASGDNGGYFVTDIARSASTSSLNSKYRKSNKSSNNRNSKGNKQRNKRRDKKKPKARKQTKNSKKRKNEKNSNNNSNNNNNKDDVDDSATATSSKPEGSIASVSSPRSKPDAISQQLDEYNGAFSRPGENSHVDFVANRDFLDNQNLIFGSDPDDYQESNLELVTQNLVKLQNLQGVTRLSAQRDHRELQPLLACNDDDGAFHSNYHTNHNPHLGAIANGGKKGDNENEREESEHEEESEFVDNFDDVVASDNDHEGGGGKHKNVPNFSSNSNVTEELEIYIDPNERRQIEEEEDFQPGSVQTDKFPEGINSNEDLIKYQEMQQRQQQHQQHKNEKSSSSQRRNSAVLDSSITAQVDGGFDVDAEDEEKHIEEPMQNGHSPVFNAQGVKKSNQVDYVAESEEDLFEDMQVNEEQNDREKHNENENDNDNEEEEHNQEGVNSADFGSVINAVLQKAQLGAKQKRAVSEEEEREKEAEDLEQDKSLQSNQPSLTEKWCEINTIVGSAPSASVDHDDNEQEAKSSSELEEFLKSISLTFYKNYHSILTENGFDTLDKIKSLKLDDLTKKMNVSSEASKRIMRQIDSVKNNNNNNEKKVGEGVKSKDDKKSKSENKKNKKKSKRNSNDGKGAAKKRNYQQAKEEKKNKNKQRKENKKKERKNRSKQKNKQKDRDNKDKDKESKLKQADVLSMEGVSDRENEDNVSVDKEELVSPKEQSVDATSSVDQTEKQQPITEEKEQPENVEEEDEPKADKTEIVKTTTKRQKSGKAPKSQQQQKEERESRDDDKEKSSPNKRKKKKRNKKRKQKNKQEAQETESQSGSTQKKDDNAATQETAVSDKDDMETMDSSSNAPSSIQYQDETNDGWITKGPKGNKKSGKSRTRKRDKNTLSSPASANAATPKSTISAKSSTSKKSFGFEAKQTQKSKKSEKATKPTKQQQNDENKKEAKKKNKKQQQKEKENTASNQHKKPPITKAKSTNNAFSDSSSNKDSRMNRKRDRKERRRDRLNRQKSASAVDTNNNYAPPAAIKIASNYSRIVSPAVLLPKSAKPSISDPLQKHNFPPLPVKTQIGKPTKNMASSTQRNKNQPNIHVNLSVLSPPHIAQTSTPSSSIKNDTSPLSVHSDGDALKRNGPSKPPLPRLHHAKKEQQTNTTHNVNSPPALQPSLVHSSQSDDVIIHHPHVQPTLLSQHSAPLSTSELSTQTSPQLSPHENVRIHMDHDDDHQGVDEHCHDNEFKLQSPHTDSASSPPSQQQQQQQQQPPPQAPQQPAHPPPASLPGFPHIPTLIAPSNNTATHMALYIDQMGNLQETPLNLSAANLANATTNTASGSPDEHTQPPQTAPLPTIPGLTTLGLNGLLAPPPQPSELGITPTTSLLPAPLGVPNVGLPPPPPLPGLPALPTVPVPGLPNVSMYLPLFTAEQIANIVANGGAPAANANLQAVSSPTNAASPTAGSASTTTTTATNTSSGTTKSTLKPRLPSFVPSKKSQKLEDIKEEDEHEHMDDDHLSISNKDDGKLPDLPMEGKKKKKSKQDEQTQKDDRTEHEEVKQSDDIATSAKDAAVMSPHPLSASSSLSSCASRSPSSRIVHVEPKSEKECLETLRRDLIEDEKEDEWVEIADLDSTLYPATLWCLHAKSFHIDPECSLKKLQQSMSSALALSS